MPCGAAAPSEDPEEQYVLTWEVQLCCMSKSECEATGAAVKSVLGVESDVTTTCTAVAGDSRRRNTGETWDARYEMEADSEDAANNIKGQLDSGSTQDAIKSQIESVTSATVSLFESQAPTFELKRGDKKGGSSGIGAGAIAAIVLSVAVVGALAGFACYKAKQPTENETAHSPRLLHGDIEGGATAGHGPTDM